MISMTFYDHKGFIHFVWLYTVEFNIPFYDLRLSQNILHKPRCPHDQVCQGFAAEESSIQEGDLLIVGHPK